MSQITMREMREAVLKLYSNQHDLGRPLYGNTDWLLRVALMSDKQVAAIYRKKVGSEEPEGEYEQLSIFDPPEVTVKEELWDVYYISIFSDATAVTTVRACTSEDAVKKAKNKLGKKIYRIIRTERL